MALVERNLKASRTLTNVKDFQSNAQQQEIIAPHGTGVGVIVYLPELTPMTFDATLTPDAWRPWVDGGQIDGFLLGVDGMSLGESGQLPTYHDTETIGVIIKDGIIPYDQVALPTGQTDAALKTALRDGMRARGFIITNLDLVH